MLFVYVTGIVIYHVVPIVDSHALLRCSGFGDLRSVADRWLHSTTTLFLFDRSVVEWSDPTRCATFYYVTSSARCYRDLPTPVTYTTHYHLPLRDVVPRYLFPLDTPIYDFLVPVRYTRYLLVGYSLPLPPYSLRYVTAISDFHHVYDLPFVPVLFYSLLLFDSRLLSFVVTLHLHVTHATHRSTPTLYLDVSFADLPRFAFPAVTRSHTDLRSFRSFWFVVYDFAFTFVDYVPV